MLNNIVNSSLVFARNSRFFQDNSFAVNQYDQTRQHPALAKNEAVQKNLRTQTESLALKILAKGPDGLYKYYDAILDNYFYLNNLSITTTDKNLSKEFRVLEASLIAFQKRVFSGIMNHTFDEAAIDRMPVNFLNFPALRNFEKTVKEYDSPMHAAARAGNVAAMRILHAKGAAIDEYKPSFDIFSDQIKGAKNCTPLAIAVEENQTEAARFLLERDADIKKKPVKVVRKNVYKEDFPILKSVKPGRMSTLVIQHLKEKIKSKPKRLIKYSKEFKQDPLWQTALLEQSIDDRDRIGSLELQVKSLMDHMESLSERMNEIDGKERHSKKIKFTKSESS